MNTVFSGKLVCVIVCAFGALYGVNFWTLGIPTNYDSYLYTAIAKFMMDFRSFFTPVGLHGAPLFFKPPATYWQAMAGMYVFGQSVLGSRIGLILVHLMSLVLFVDILRRLEVKKSAIVMAMLMFGCSFASFKLTRNLVMENLLACWVLLSVWLFIRAKNEQRSLFVWMASFLAGLACLIKGFIVPPMYGVLLLSFLVIYRGRLELSFIQVVGWGLLHVIVAIVVGLAWPGVMYGIHGHVFWDTYFVGEHLSKLGGYPNPPGRIIAGFLIYSLPFLHVGIFSGAWAIMNFQRMRRSTQFFLLSVLGLIALFLIPTRRDLNYVLPFISVTFLLAGVLWEDVEIYFRKRVFIRLVNALCIMACGVYGAVAIQVFHVSIWILSLGVICIVCFGVNMVLNRKYQMEIQSGMLCIFSFLVWSVFLPVVILPTYPSHARPSDKNIPVCIARPRPSDYGVYLEMVPFLPNTISYAADEVSTRACIDQRHAWVVDENNTALTDQLTDHGYKKSSTWSVLEPKLDGRVYLRALQTGDTTDITAHRATYMPY